MEQSGISQRCPSVVALAVAVLLPMTASGQTVETVAQGVFEEGMARFDSGDFEGALETFTESMEVQRSPNSRLMKARCLRELGRNAEAVAEYRLAEGEAVDRARREPRYRQTEEAAGREREALLPLVGWITIELEDPPEGVVIRLSGREVPPQALDLEIPVDPGRVTLQVEAEGCQRVERVVELEAGERRTVRVHLECSRAAPEAVELPPTASPAEDARRDRFRSWQTSHRSGLRAGTFLTAALAVGFGVAFGVLAGQAGALFDQLEQDCGGPCPPDRQGDVERGQSLELGANLSLALGSTAVVLAVVLAILTPWRQPAMPPPDVASTLWLALSGEQAR